MLTLEFGQPSRLGVLLKLWGGLAHDGSRRHDVVVGERHTEKEPHV